MRFKYSIIISVFIHIGAAAAVILHLGHKNPPSSLGGGSGSMDILLIAPPQTAKVSQEHIFVPARPSNPETAPLRRDIQQASAVSSEENGNGTDRVNYREVGGGGSAYNAYFVKVREKIIRSKFYPKDALVCNSEGKIVVSFDIERSGNLRSVTVTKPCSFAPLNDAAVITIKKAAPFKPFPDNLKENLITLQITLEYKLPKLAQAF